MTTELTCPTCGTQSHFEELTRDAAAFCRVCDFPLFWVRTARLQVATGPVSDTGLRRLPGAAGRVAIATFPCPSCTEPNPLTANICIRCGADLHPSPVVDEPAPEPLTEATPLVAVAEKKTVWWPWALVSALGVIAIVLILFLTHH